MDCAACATKIENAVGRLPEVDGVAVSVTAGTIAIEHANGLVPGTVEGRVEKLGYTIAPLNTDGEEHNHKGAASTSVLDADGGPWWRSRKAKLTISCGIALVIAWLAGWLFPAISNWAFFMAMAVGLIPIARRAVAAARAGSPFTIETLMTIAAVGAVLIGATEEAAMVVLLFLIGETLEGVAAGRARAGIRGLASLVPDSALVEEEGTTRELPASALQVGSVILVRPGDRIAADGEIVDGESSIDEAPVTGESTPALKKPGDVVFAGTINSDAVLRVRVTASAENNTIARVVRLVEESQESKSPTERFIDRFARSYTPMVLVVGALVAIAPPLMVGAEWGTWIYRGLAVLLIGCPCALVISTPAAVAAGLSAGARRGLLMKGGAVLERLRDVTAVAFDKTGTLTNGRPVVTDVVGFRMSEDDVLTLAASLERGSSHPVARAVLDRADAAGVRTHQAMTVNALPGKGIRGTIGGRRVFLASPTAATEDAALARSQETLIDRLSDEGKTVSVLVVDGGVAGLIAVRDEPRNDALAGIRALSDGGVASLMLTGDNERTGAAIGSELGIDVHAGLMPEDKLRIVHQLQQRGEVVAKVGDGINDAPALAAADVGIAVGSGTDVALETADAAILHGRVSDISHMIGLSRKVMRNIMQNITIALGLKAVFLVTTISGITGLWPAILADTGATVLVTLNALRLLATRFD